MNEFKPQALSEEEIRGWFGGVTDEEFALARERSLTPLKDEILFQGIPGTALVKDTTGKTYIDCTAQAWTLNSGYCNPDVLAAVAEQMKYLTHVRYGYPTVPRIKLINRLGELFPGDLKKVCLNIQGGGAAIEAAMKLAMINKPGATTFLVAWRGYHGASLATFGATHYMPYLSRFSGFGLGHFAKFPYPYCYRCPIGREPQTCDLACLELVEGTIKYGVNTPVAGLIIEPMQGAGGQVPTPPGYLAGLKEICEKYGIYLIYDECQTAFGRVGAMSAAEYYGVPPDMMVLSKSLGGGFPIGALLARSDLKGPAGLRRGAGEHRGDAAHGSAGAGTQAGRAHHGLSERSPAEVRDYRRCAWGGAVHRRRVGGRPGEQEAGDRAGGGFRGDG